MVLMAVGQVKPHTIDGGHENSRKKRVTGIFVAVSRDLVKRRAGGQLPQFIAIGIVVPQVDHAVWPEHFYAVFHKIHITVRIG